MSVRAQQRISIPRGLGQRKIERPRVATVGLSEELCPSLRPTAKTMWHLLDDGIKHRLNSGEKRKFLFLERHDSLPLQWQVESFDVTYLERMSDVISAYDTVTVFGIDGFIAKAAEEGFEVVFLEDPTDEFRWLASLSEPVGVSIAEPHLPSATPEGFLPCQAQGINFAKMRRATYMNWSTGVGKSVGMLGLIEWYIEQGLVDIVLTFVKTNNKINTERGFERLWNIETDPRAVIIDGTPKRREKQYINAARTMLSGEVPIIVTNHEKMRDDCEAMKMLLEDRRVLVLWDEMSSKLGNENTVYRGAVEALYTSYTSRKKTKKVNGETVSEEVRYYYPKSGHERTKEVYHVALSATPIEHNPGQWFNQFQIMDPSIYGSRRNFESMFARGRDPWNNVVWDRHKLPLIGLMALDAIHQVDKTDPDIAAQFPEVMPPETLYLEMSQGEAYLYDKLVSEYESMRGADASILDETEVLAAIGVLELICCNPIAVLESAMDFQAWMDSGADPDERKGSQVAWKLRELVNNDKKFDIMPTKAVRLIEEINEDPSEKFVVFTSLNEHLLPHLSRWLDDADISHVLYHGGLSMKQKQAAEDAFQNDPNIRVFLSSDAGSDSINLHAAAEVIHYNDPWSYAKKIQRQNRINRVVSDRAFNRYRTLRFAGTYEDRKEEVIEMKKGYHDSILRGAVAEQAKQLRHGDYMYIFLGGDRE